MDGSFLKTQLTKINSELQNAKLIAVTKKQPIEKIEFLYQLGQRIFAENYVQEFLEKKEKLNHLEIKWHLIGPLQSNKVLKIVGEIELIHSVDSLELAQKISNAAIEKKVIQNILIQLNISGEGSKSGFSMNQFEKLKKQLFSLKNIRILGFMMMPLMTQNAEDSRKYFKSLKQIQIDTKKEYDFINELSMGTTQDYKIALEEGSTMIRIGEALLGSRK